MSESGLDPEANGFRAGEAFALELDADDPLSHLRDRFHIPRRKNGEPSIYFCGHSLGLQPKTAAGAVRKELDDWAALGVDAHFQGSTPWYSYPESMHETAARVVGARPHEVVLMNGLTVNLHLLMATFYAPTRERFKVVMEDPAFPTDTYAVRTQIRLHGFHTDEALLTVKPREGEHQIRLEDVEELLQRNGQHIALVLLGGVNYYTGQVFDMARITRAAHRAGCTVGLDLAHAAGNVELRLHDWDIDFAVWCTYKYLNSGPGSVAGCFIHERHARNTNLPRFGGWWGNDPETRFRMHLEREFKPQANADGWQLSNPPILSMAPLKASLEVFDEVGMPMLRGKSKRLTGYLQFLLDRSCDGLRAARYEVITPRPPEERGCQTSILVHENPAELFAQLHDAGIIADYRPPNVIRVAPVPLYNTFHEVWRFARIMSESG